jgi:hypothetical protein
MIQINGDVYNIAKRIKNIDRNYYVVFNTSKQKFEVHNSSQSGSSYCLTLPHNQLDERALNFVHQTKSANIDEILEQIENNNNLKESAIRTSAFSNIADEINNLEN